MRLTRIYQNIYLAPDITIELSADVVKHLITVLRLKEGDDFIIFNGEGGEYEATIKQIAKKTVKATIGKYIKQDVESPLSVHLFQSIAKGEKMDWIIQKTVELGITEITPVISDFCHVNLDTERLNKKQAHWQKIAIQSAEQCERTKITQVHSPIQFSTVFSLKKEVADLRLILHPYAECSLREVLAKLPLHSKRLSIAMMIGPEGGFNETEVQLAIQNQLIPITLGPRILRTETASISLLSILQFYFGDFVS
jgi:16S rRNA (uracil1498-N3)-methyltransferase